MTDDPRNIELRRFLMDRLVETVQAWGVSQSTAAARLGITQPRVNLLLRYKEERFSVDNLIELAQRAGLDVQMTVSGATFTVAAAAVSEACHSWVSHSDGSS